MPRALALFLCMLTALAVSVTVALAASVYQAQKAFKERGYVLERLMVGKKADGEVIRNGH
jgi:hypothetical protein